MKYLIAALFFLLAWLFASEGLGFLAFATVVVLVVLAMAGYGSGGEAFAKSPEGGEGTAAGGEGAVESSPDPQSQEIKQSEPWGEPSG